jgi:arsenite methyltransferase
MNEAVLAPGWLRPARVTDLEAVEALLRSAGLPHEGVADQFEDGFVVAELDGMLAGVAGVEIYGSAGLIRSVAVSEAARGRGLGRRLVADRLRFAIGRGLRGVYLLTTDAAGFFSGLGFIPVARDDVPGSIRRSPEFAGICPTTATAMVRVLASSGGGSCCGGPARAPGADLGVVAEFDRNDPESLKATVRSKYGAAASRAAAGAPSSCCGASADELWDPITADLYDEGETEGLPAEALLASLGCGNPTALASLNEGEVVLDLGSGGGIDVLLSARRVGPTGRAYGLDMTDEMLELARANQARAGATNVEFLKGDIESIPLPDESVDVIISNCVINLAADKGAVLREAFRVLKPGGRFAVSDVVARREVPAAIRGNMELWIGCVAGALSEDEYLSLLAEAGFTTPSIEPTRNYTADDASHFLEGAGLPLPERLDDYEGAFFSGFVRAVKPAVTG